MFIGFGFHELLKVFCFLIKKLYAKGNDDLKMSAVYSRLNLILEKNMLYKLQ
jgi:hypothetical protein